jgi:PadR family transcriptional regulator, regulatory protein PadR
MEASFMGKVDLLQGTLDMLILKTLTGGAMHGYEVARWIQQTTDDVLQVEEGSLYPALHRLERRGWITAEWGLSEQNRKAKYYKLTRVGRKQLEAAASSWQSLSEAIAKVMQTA